MGAFQRTEKRCNLEPSLFPRLPILICYWSPEDGLESELHLFFDRTAEENLNIEYIYSLGMGIASMLEKIMLKHT